MRVESIGKSHEGHDIWVVTVTNFATGEAGEKPALWVDGNIHATEVSPSSACLYLLNSLASGYGNDDDITRCLDTRAFYVCPRVNPDGAEWALADAPKFIRSSTRAYPYLRNRLSAPCFSYGGESRVTTGRQEYPPLDVIIYYAVQLGYENV